VIEVRGLYKSFDGKPILRGIDLDFEECETTVILGPSGQGKTVLIKTLVRLIEPDAGRVSFDGEDIHALPIKRFRRLQNQMAFVFQANALFDFLNVRDNLSLFMRMHRGLSPDEAESHVLSAVRFVGLDSSVLDKYPEELSGGMQKRVAVARGILKDPRVIFYDEPTVGLDEGNVRKIVELIQRLKEHVCATSVIVTHDIPLMQKVADKVALLREGRIVFTGRKEDVTAEMLQNLYAMGGDHES
jgi:phospholipid/cholesterol/gamma-HCH transport system ATP-binding protein